MRSYGVLVICMGLLCVRGTEALSAETAPPPSRKSFSSPSAVQALAQPSQAGQANSGPNQPMPPAAMAPIRPASPSAVMPGSGGGLPKVAAPSSSADSQQQSSPAVLVSNALKEAAAQLSRAINPEVKARPTIVVSMVDAENLQKTSALGRVLSQQMMYHLQANGWPIVDLRVSRELTMKPEGEFVLSRDLSKARGSLQVGNVVSGTYTDAGGVVVIAFQVSDLGTGTVLTNAQSVLEINPYVASLFKADVEVLSDAPVIRKVR